MNLTRPSLSMLPMEDIAAELKTNKVNRGFMTKEDIATDTDKVGGISNKRIAISIEGDRNTVANSLKLNGLSASEYVTKEDGDRFINVADELSKISSDEIRNIKDELYQLYGELAKKGFIQSTMKYEGFVEAFKKDQVLYEDYICGISTSNVTKTQEIYISEPNLRHFFEEGKFFVIKRSDTGQEKKVKSLGVNLSGKVTMDSSVDFLSDATKIGLFKSNGQYTNDTFSFSQIKKAVSDSKERYYSQSDDTDTKYLTINEPGTGFAAIFKVPRNLNSSLGIAGALSKFAIRAQAVDNPGPLRCHVVDYSAVINTAGGMPILDPKFSSVEDAINQGLVLATSSFIHPSRDNTISEQDVYFDFHDGVHDNYNKVAKDINFFESELTESETPFKTADGFPILADKKYCFIIESAGISSSSFWRIRFSYYNNNDFVDDLHRRNVSYVYKAIDETGLTNGEQCLQVIDEINKYDIMYTLVVKDIIEEEEAGKKEGLYTTRVLLPNPIDVTRARLSMQINREGMYNIKDHNSEYTIFTLEPSSDGAHSPSDTRFKIGEKIVIGNRIGIIKRISTNEIEVEKAVELDERTISIYTTKKYDKKTNSVIKETTIPVYRINGFTPTLKAKLVDYSNFNELTNAFNAVDVTTKPLELELKNIIPTMNNDDVRISDRLIYEVDFGKSVDNKNLVGNEFELQIDWISPFSEKEINEVRDVKDSNFKELIGRIHDLTLTFDKHY